MAKKQTYIFPDGSRVWTYRKQYFEAWERYIDFLESVGLIVTGFNPGFSCYWKKDEYTKDGLLCYKADTCVQLSVDVVDIMMQLKERLDDAEADCLRLHKEKMELYFELQKVQK